MEIPSAFPKNEISTSSTSPYIIGITGGSGSGKTSFLHALIEKIGKEHLCLLSQDNYYKSKDLQLKDENGIENFDTPEAFDFELFKSHIHQLMAGFSVKKHEYIYNREDKTPNELVFHPAPILIIEGIFSFHDTQIRELMNLKIFIDAKTHIKIKRRIMRDNIERGYDLHDVLYRYEHHVMPSYEQYIKKHRENADLIVCNHHSFDKALEVIATFLKTKIYL